MYEKLAFLKTITDFNIMSVPRSRLYNFC